MIAIRPERPDDMAAVFAVHAAAFPTDAEARLVDRVRAAGEARLSLVAEANGAVVGHVLFSPVSIETASGHRTGFGLAPVAVLPAHQRQGVGSALIREGLAICRQQRCLFVVVLGHPAYYPRFGFRRASDVGLSNEYGADDAFMVIELETGALPADGGLVKYGPELIRPFTQWP